MRGLVGLYLEAFWRASGQSRLALAVCEVSIRVVKTWGAPEVSAWCLDGAGAFAEPWRRNVLYWALSARVALQFTSGRPTLSSEAPCANLPLRRQLAAEYTNGPRFASTDLAVVKDRHSVQPRAFCTLQCTGWRLPRLAAHHAAPHQPGAASLAAEPCSARTQAQTRTRPRKALALPGMLARRPCAPRAASRWPRRS